MWKKTLKNGNFILKDLETALNFELEIDWQPCLRDFYIVFDHIFAFCFSLLHKDLATFHKLFFEAFLCFFFDSI